jgi:hypothetical protein
MMAKSAEARKICRDLDKELEAVGQQQGQTLVWSAQERPIIGLISAQIDWKCELLEAYEPSTDAKIRCKLSSEARLLETSNARLLRQVKTDVPAADTAES